jgi:membrane protease YdiL (CAAX protease family)
MLEVLFAVLVCVLIPLRASRRYWHKLPPAPPGLYVLETALLTGALAGLLYRRGVPLTAIGIQPPFTLEFLANLVICLTPVIGMDIFAMLLAIRCMRTMAGISAGNSGVFVDALRAKRAWRWFIPVAILGAVWEELCFRSVVFLLLPHTFGGVALGVACGSVLFGSQHLRNGLAGLAYASFYGALFSCVYLITSDLIAVIVAHAAGNLFAALYAAPRIALARQASVFLG